MTELPRKPSLALQPVHRAGVHVFAWGRDDLGQLGLNVASDAGDASIESVLLPTQLTALVNADVTHVALGPYNSAFLTAEGEVYTCGANDQGQLGVKSARPGQLTRVGALDIHKVVHAAYGQNHALAVTDKGLCLSWGDGEWGQLGLGVDTLSQTVPKSLRLPRHIRIARVAAGGCHSVALSTTGQVWSWGQGTFGALGHGNDDNCSTPTAIQALWPLGVVQVACGENHSMALTASGHVYTWGRGKVGTLGLGDTKNRSLPHVVQALRDKPMVQVACGGDHSLALTAGGQVYSWGGNTWGQLGVGSTDHTYLPTHVTGALSTQRVVQVAAGLRHSVALASSNHILVWGCGEFGQLGNGQTTLAHVTPLPLPDTVLPAIPVLFISAGGGHVMAVLKDVSPGDKVVIGPVPPSLLPLSHQPAHGAGMLPLPLPKLMLLTEAAATELQRQRHEGPAAQAAAPATNGSDEKGSSSSPQRPAGVAAAEQLSGSPTKAATAVTSPSSLSRSHATGAVGPAVATLLYAIEDVFSSPGYLTAGFARPTSATSAASATAAKDNDTVELAAVAEDGGIASPVSPKSDSMNVDARDLTASVVASAGPAIGSVPADDDDDDGEEKMLQLAVDGALHRLGITAHHLDVGAVNAVYEALLKLYSTEVITSLATACNTLADAADVALRAADPADASALAPTLLPALHILAQNPVNALLIASNSSGSSGGACGGGGGAACVWRTLCSCLMALPKDHRWTLMCWVASLPSVTFGGRVLRPLQQYLTRCVDQPATSTRHDTLMVAQVIAQLRKAQAALEAETCTWGNTALLGARPGDMGYSPVLYALPASEWYNTRLSETINLREEYQRYVEWLDKAGHAGEAPSINSFCSTATLLTPEAKSRIIQGEALLQKQVHMQNSALSALFQGINPGAVAFLDVHVRRSHVMQDALTQILHRSRDLKKPLRVTFIGPGGVAEEGLDEGGVSREFFQLLVAEIFKPEYGMFVWSDETRNYWFSSVGEIADQELELEYQLVGVVLGLAIYNNIILDVHFPLIVYKKLLGRKPQWRDLCETQPQLAKGLAALLHFNGDVQSTFCRTFEVEYEYFGSKHTKELMANGANIPVTAENRLQYVQLYTQWALDTSVKTQFDAFKSGFHAVCGGPALSMLSPPQLELLVAGLPHLDFHALENGARYDGGYTASSPAVRWFWDTLHSFTLEQKKRFLAFTTGCDRAPVGGLGKLTLTIQKSGPDSNRLPTSHTCFNVLLLPDYATQAKLRDLLLMAIENAQGFGLM